VLLKRIADVGHRRRPGRDARHMPLRVSGSAMNMAASQDPKGVGDFQSAQSVAELLHPVSMYQSKSRGMPALNTARGMRVPAKS
jgi:hypothetical protein